MKFFIWASLLIINLVVSGICIKVISNNGIPNSQALVVRGLGCLLLCFLFAFHKKLSLKPNSLKIQISRAFLAGFALTFFSLSYRWLTASAVAILSNVDFPVLIILGSLVGTKTSLKVKLLSAFTISILIYFVSTLEMQKSLFYGLSSLLVGIIMLCFGYQFIKKSMGKENEAVTILVPAVAIIFFGMIESPIESMNLSTWNLNLAVVDLISGFAMFGAYIATMKLYSITDLVSAEFPTLLSSILIQPIEIILLNTNISFSYVISSISFVVLMYFILRLQNKKTCIDLPRVAQTLDFTCGASCFESMYLYLRGTSLGEMHFANELKTLELGFTDPQLVLDLTKKYGFTSNMKINGQLSDLDDALKNGEVVFVTWWDEDAGHYSLVKQMNKKEILLMDPWTARDNKDNLLDIHFFYKNWQLRGGKMIQVK